MPRNKKPLPALDNAPKIANPDLPNVYDRNYTDTILKYGGLATKYPQLETTAKTVVAAINELNGRPIPEPVKPTGHSGSDVIANPPVGTFIISTDADELLESNKNKLLEISTGTPAGILYSISIDGEVYTIDTGVAYLDELLDVEISTATAGQILTYNGEDWVNSNPKDVPIGLDDLDDVSVTSATNGQVLTYEDGVWVNSDPAAIPSALDDLTDVDINDPISGQVLKYEDGAWKNATDSSGISKLSELEDVDVSTVVSGQFLKYDGTEWTNSKVDNDYVWEGTQAEYDAIVEKDPEITYFITDAPAQRFNADAVVYNNANTKLTATTVQSAITEIVTTNIYWTDLVGILPTGSTSIRFQNSVITPNSTINVFVDSAFFGVSPTSITITPGIAVIGFEEQANDMPVKVRIS